MTNAPGGTRRCSGAIRCIVDLPVTVGMEEDQVRRSIILVVAISVMQFEGLLALDHLSTDGALSVLLLQDFSTKRRRCLLRQLPITVLKVRLPFASERVGVPFDLDMALRGDCLPHPDELFAGVCLSRHDAGHPPSAPPPASGTHTRRVPGARAQSHQPIHPAGDRQKRAPTTPTVTGVLSAVPLRPCNKGSPSLWRSSPTTMRGCVTESSPSSKPPGPMTPTPCSCSTPCPASARFSALGCSTKSMLAPASPGARRLSPLASGSHGPRHTLRNAWARQAPRAGMPLAKGPCLKPPSCT